MYIHIYYAVYNIFMYKLCINIYIYKLIENTNQKSYLLFYKTDSIHVVIKPIHNHPNEIARKNKIIIFIAN